MDEELQPYQPEPKISDVELILIGLFYLILDFLDFIPVVGDITDIIVAPMGYYYWVKGLNGVTFIVAEIIEAIPGAQEFPFIRIITWGITVWMDRHPALEAAIAPVLAIGGALEGDVAGAEGEMGQLNRTASSTASGSPSNANVLEMTQTEPGTYEYRPQAGADVQDSSNSSLSNGRPSDTSTERGSGSEGVDGSGGKQGRRLVEEENLPDLGSESGDEDGEGERLKREKEEAANARYEEIVTPEAERNPVDVARENELGNVVPINRARKPAPPPPAPRRHQAPIAGSISREQAKLQAAEEEQRRQLGSIKAPGEVVDDDIARAA